MKHELSKVKVYCTADYKVFKLVDGNRLTARKKVEKILSEIKSGNDVLDECPILVTEHNGYLEVKDGQHRLQVAKELKRPVNYIIKSREMSLYNVAKMNSNTDKWKPMDFINAYSKAGNENYTKLKSFHQKYKIAIGVCLTILVNGLVMHDGTIVSAYEDFEQGKFQIKKWKEGVQFAELCQNFSDYPQWNTRGFLISISKIIRADKCEMDVLMKKFKEDPKQLTYHSQWKDIINNLEQIYNKGNSKRRVIF